MQLVPSPASGAAPSGSPLSRGVALRRAIEGLGEREARLLAILALVRVANISTLTRLAAVAGLRASAARQFSTTGLREIFEELAVKRLVTIRDGVFECAHGVGLAALRAVHQAGGLAALASQVTAEVYP
jgi:hypothetical protein